MVVVVGLLGALEIGLQGLEGLLGRGQVVGEKGLAQGGEIRQATELCPLVDTACTAVVEFWLPDALVVPVVVAFCACPAAPGSGGSNRAAKASIAEADPWLEPSPWTWAVWVNQELVFRADTLDMVCLLGTLACKSGARNFAEMTPPRVQPLGDGRRFGLAAQSLRGRTSPKRASGSAPFRGTRTPLEVQDQQHRGNPQQDQQEVPRDPVQV